MHTEHVLLCMDDSSDYDDETSEMSDEFQYQSFACVTSPYFQEGRLFYPAPHVRPAKIRYDVSVTFAESE